MKQHEQPKTRMEKLMEMMSQLSANDFNDAKTLNALGDEQRAPQMLKNQTDTTTAHLMSGMQYPNEAMFSLMRQRGLMPAQEEQDPTAAMIAHMSKQPNGQKMLAALQAAGVLPATQPQPLTH